MMRDRLTEIVKPFVSGSACEHESGSCELTDCRSCNARSLADHLLASGVICPPCKIGDTVWVVSQGQGMNMRWDVYEGKVSDIHINTHADLEIRAKNGEKFFGYYKPCSVFLTKEEAERALAERSEK